MRLNFTITALLLLIGIGFWGGLSVSYANLTGEQACPHLAGLAICYVVAIAYGSMLTSLFLRQPALHYAMFLAAWVVTFLASPRSISINGDAVVVGGGVGDAIYY